MISIRQLSCGYSGSSVLSSITLDLKPGQITVVIGKNGSGKSTLAHVLAGLNLKFRGQVQLDDLLLNRRTSNRKIRQKVGLVLQNPEHQIIFNRVYDEIDFTLRNLNLPKSQTATDSQPVVLRQFLHTQRDAVIMEALDLVGLSGYAESDPHQLSGGQKQRLAIANVLATHPRYIVLDEATSMLDLVGRRAIYRILSRLKEQGIGIILMTNALEEILLADTVIILDNGQAYQFSPQNIIQDLSILTQHHLEIPLLLKIAQKFETFNLESLQDKI